MRDSNLAEVISGGGGVRVTFVKNPVMQDDLSLLSV